MSGFLPRDGGCRWQGQQAPYQMSLGPGGLGSQPEENLTPLLAESE